MTKRAPKRAARKPAKKAPRAKSAQSVPPPKAAPKAASRLAPSRARLRSRRTVMPPRPRVTSAPSNSAYDALPRTKANFQPLTPLAMLERAASVFPAHTAIIHGKQRFSYAEFYRRSRLLASALAQHGIGKNDTVAAMLANTPAMLEAHYGVPMAGGVLNALNTRLDAASIAHMLEHGGAKILITDREFSSVIGEALKQLKQPPLVIDYNDPEFPQQGAKLGEDYENFLASGDPDFAWLMPNDEWDAISLNYTSGTTGKPKGVVYHHRGASLMGFS
ncbi:MAG TPA: AMP-binding protein, partial [Rhizomicrobium sp.]|nr:AMP-binding protein [Rhizomicrobium sp.]